MKKSVIQRQRPDIFESFDHFNEWLSAPGHWLSGVQRIDVAKATRAVADCSACRTISDALSPKSLDHQHQCVTGLPAPVEVVIHRLISDQTRLTSADISSLSDQFCADSACAYVEILGVAVCQFSVDEFHRGLGLALPELPEPKEGRPDHYLPVHLETDTAWVPMIPTDQVSPAEQDLWPGNRGANVLRALSAAPDTVRAWQHLSETMYLSLQGMAEMIHAPNRILSRMQMELIAGRVSALNQCLY